MTALVPTGDRRGQGGAVGGNACLVRRRIGPGVTARLAGVALGCMLGVELLGGGAGGGPGSVELPVADVAAVSDRSEVPPIDTVDPSPGAGVPAPGARYAWPLSPAPVIAARFQAPAHVYGPGHRGVDLIGAPGQAVLAARHGTVVFAGPIAGRGVASVQHDDGLRTTYEPVRPVLTAGTVVRAGDVVGLLEPGHPGCAPAVCLHWGVRRGRVEYLDPFVLLRPLRVRLLPVPDPWPGDVP